MKSKKIQMPHPFRQSVKSDPVDPRDFQKLNLIYCCEQCSHFDGDNIRCTIGYNCQNHLREANLKQYELTGRLTFCRYLEID